MNNSLWVRLHILWKAVSSHLFNLWPTGSEWDCTFCERQSHDSHHIFSYDQQKVSEIVALFVKGSLITSFPMTNRKWVRLHIVWKAVSSHLFLWPTASEWDCTVKGSLIKSFPMTNRKWVTLYILWKAMISLHLFLLPTATCECHCTFVKGSPITLVYMTNRLWVTLYILQKAVSHLSLWPTVCEWCHTFSDLQSQHTQYMNVWYIIGSYVYQQVSMLTYLFHVFLLHS